MTFRIQMLRRYSVPATPWADLVLKKLSWNFQHHGSLCIAYFFQGRVP
jgi:hypothetical protein